MPALAITVLGHDRPGIIAEVTASLAELGGNLEDSSMTLLRGHFAMTLIVRTDAEVAEIERRLAHLADEGLRVHVIVVPDEDPDLGIGERFLLSVHGADRAGIVSAITAVVASHGGNIVDLTTRLGRNLYLLTAEVELPGDADRTSLDRDLHEAAARIGVEVSFMPSDVDLI
jgi:glycine cleavage system transcriptional repressor